MSTVPSSAEAILRSSSTFQSVPTPRQSAVKWPVTRPIARSSSAAVSCSLLPSVSRMACRIGMSRRVRKSWSALVSQVPMAVPPAAVSRRSDSRARARVSGEAMARVPSPGKTSRASWVPATTAKATPSRTVSTAAAVASRAPRILLDG